MRVFVALTVALFLCACSSSILPANVHSQALTNAEPFNVSGEGLGAGAGSQNLTLQFENGFKPSHNSLISMTASLPQCIASVKPNVAYLSSKKGEKTKVAIKSSTENKCSKRTRKVWLTLKMLPGCCVIAHWTGALALVYNPNQNKGWLATFSGKGRLLTRRNKWVTICTDPALTNSAVTNMELIRFYKCKS
jgi:hypothetical protein